MLLGFLFLMNQERERRIIYKGTAGEEKEAFLARGAYESLEEKRNEKLPDNRDKMAEGKQEGRENRKISLRNQPELRDNLKKHEDKLKRHEDNPKKIGDYPKYQDIYELLSDNICQ